MIDDVEFLTENAEKDSRVLYIDSNKRNMIFHPNPSEYVINFEQPFKYVYGFEILDASIPVTMYNIDKYNNQLYYIKLEVNTSKANIEKGLDFYKEISQAYDYHRMITSDDQTYFVVGDYSTLNIFENIDTNLVLSNHHLVYRYEIYTDQIFKKSKIISSNNIYVFVYEEKEYYVLDVPSNQSLIAKLRTKNFYMNYDQNNTTNIFIVFFEVQLISISTYQSIVTSGLHIFEVKNLIGSVDIGNQDFTSLVTDMNTMFSTSEIYVESVSPVPTKKYMIKMTSQSGFFAINPNRGAFIKSIGFNMIPSILPTSDYVNIKLGNDQYVFGSPFNATDSFYYINSPGLVNLTGERYVVLRIKELEDHINGSYGTMNTVRGIAMFKLAEPFGGITNLRFDFGSIVRKPFHPIGKLSKLSIRFETSDGLLYDFRGVNHQIMVNLMFYIPQKKGKFQKSSLNPYYNPDMMKYLSNHQTIQNVEPSDEEEDDAGEEIDDINYKKNMIKYDYSSSDDDSAGNSNSTFESEVEDEEEDK